MAQLHFNISIPAEAASVHICQIRVGNQNDLISNPCSPQNYLQQPEASPGLLYPHKIVNSAMQGTYSNSTFSWSKEIVATRAVVSTPEHSGVVVASLD